MKKLKSVLILLAIVLSVSAAIAGLPEPYCQQQTQYFKMITPWGYYYFPAGTRGIDYVCDYAPFKHCTYFKVSGTEQYMLCQEGQFTPICVY